MRICPLPPQFTAPSGQWILFIPLSINVGLSRKVSKDYQSTGVSINVAAELDQALLARPDQLQKQIGDLYAQAHHALDGRMSRLAESEWSCSRPATRNNRSNGNGRDADNRQPHRPIAWRS